MNIEELNRVHDGRAINMSDIHGYLKEQGFKGGDFDRFSKGRLYWRRVDGHPNPCLTNDKLSVHVTVYETNIPPHPVSRSVECEIVGEYREGRWVKLQVYSLSWEELMANGELDRVQSELVRAWDALYGS